MSALQTIVGIPDSPFRFSYESKLMFLGSCFANNVGKKMKHLKFDVCHNPFGVLYNPQSIASNLNLLLDKDCFHPEDLSFHNELWYSYSHYTLFSDPDQQACLKTINDSFLLAREQIQSADILFITLGTSWFYRLIESQEIVANCHKLPNSHFLRSFSSIEQSSDSLEKVFSRLKKINPKLQIVLTVSPIRHWKDGAIENQRSKAALALTISELQQKLNFIFYFPVYEIFMDELRDYRFYASDLLHPSEAGLDYIWEKFTNTFFTQETLKLSSKVAKLLAAIEHKPRFISTHAYQKFKQSYQKSKAEITKDYPFLTFD